MTTTILVSNVSPKATQKSVADFFSFCGKIVNLSMRKQSSSIDAVIEFDSESSAKTALLLTNALIEDRPITVTLYEGLVSQPTSSNEATSSTSTSTSTTAPTSTPTSTSPSNVNSESRPPPSVDDDDWSVPSDLHRNRTNDSFEADDGFTAMNPTDIPNKQFGNVPDSERSSTSVIASMLAAGYTLGVGALDSAKDLDERANISRTIGAGTESAKTKLSEFDQQYGISNTATAIGSQIAEGAAALGEQISYTWRGIDHTYNVSERTAAATNTISHSVSTATHTALENPTVANALNTISSWGQAFSAMITPVAQSTAAVLTREVEEIKVATQSKISEVDRNRGVAQPTERELSGAQFASPVAHNNNNSTTTTTTNDNSSSIHPNVGHDLDLELELDDHNASNFVGDDDHNTV